MSYVNVLSLTQIFFFLYLTNREVVSVPKAVSEHVIAKVRYDEGRV